MLLNSEERQPNKTTASAVVDSVFQYYAPTQLQYLLDIKIRNWDLAKTNWARIEAMYLLQIMISQGDFQF